MGTHGDGEGEQGRILFMSPYDPVSQYELSTVVCGAWLQWRCVAHDGVMGGAAGDTVSHPAPVQCPYSTQRIVYSCKVVEGSVF